MPSTYYTCDLYYICDQLLHLCLQHTFPFSLNVSDEDVVSLNATRDCIRDLQDWLARDRLKLNDNKTEFLLIGTRQQLVKVNLSRITVGNEAIEVLGKCLPAKLLVRLNYTTDNSL